MTTIDPEYFLSQIAMGPAFAPLGSTIFLALSAHYQIMVENTDGTTQLKVYRKQELPISKSQANTKTMVFAVKWTLADPLIYVLA